MASIRGNSVMRTLLWSLDAVNIRILSCLLCPCPMANVDLRWQKLSTAPMTQPAQTTVQVMRLVLLGVSTVRQLAKSLKKHSRLTKNGMSSTTMWRKRRKLKCARIWSISGSANSVKTVVSLITLGNSKRKSTFQATT